MLDQYKMCTLKQRERSSTKSLIKGLWLRLEIMVTNAISEREHVDKAATFLTIDAL